MNDSRYKLLFTVTLLAIQYAMLPPAVFAQTKSITYQGNLSDGGSPANGYYDLSFELFDAPSNGVSVVSAIVSNAVLVTEGYFTVMLDFGAGVFDGSDLWLEIGATTNGGGVFTTLSPRQQVTAAPYAIKAGNAMTVDMGTISDPGFIGTTTTTPLVLSVSNTTALRLEYPTVGSVPNLIGGDSGNIVSNGVQGAVIGGGVNNIVGGDFGTVVGGNFNRASGAYSTAMGLAATASGYSSTAIGNGTTASGDFSTAIGYSTTASGVVCTAIGYNTAASHYSTAIGYFTRALNYYSTAMGYDTTASGEASTAMGSLTTASGDFSTAMGLFSVASGDFSTAMGIRAKAIHDGTFVWADSANAFAFFSSTSSNQFLIRASGGVGIGTASPVSALDVDGDVTAAGYMLSSPRTLSLNLPGNTLNVDNDTDEYSRTASGYIYQGAGTAALTLYGDVNLPQGAEVTGASLYYYDNTGSGDFIDINGRLRRRALGSTAVENLLVLSDNSPATGASSSMNTLVHTSLEPTRVVIDNDQYHYWIYATMTCDTPGSSSLRMYGFQINYTLEEVLP